LQNILIIQTLYCVRHKLYASFHARLVVSRISSWKCNIFKRRVFIIPIFCVMNILSRDLIIFSLCSFYETVKLNYVYLIIIGRNYCYGPIPRPEVSYRVWLICVCDFENVNNEAAYDQVAGA